MSGKTLVVEDSALNAIADMAIARETGVRALRAILEDLLLDLLYELPCRKDCDEFVIDDDVVRGRRRLAKGLTADDLEPEPVIEAPTSIPHATEEEDPGEERESA
jgi:ATP-dependent protease Clp ATPase subunit